MPCVQAILAEVYYARQRGRAFGLLFTISAFGGMLFNFVAVTFGDRTVGGLPVRCCSPLHSALLAAHLYCSCYKFIQPHACHTQLTDSSFPAQGWRVIFFIVAAFAFVSGVLVFIGGIEPRNLEAKEVVSEADRRERQESPMKAVWKGILVILNSVQRVFRIRSFQVILVVGIIETFHWVRLHQLHCSSCGKTYLMQRPHRVWLFQSTLLCSHSRAVVHTQLMGVLCAGLSGIPGHVAAGKALSLLSLVRRMHVLHTNTS